MKLDAGRPSDGSRTSLIPVEERASGVTGVTMAGARAGDEDGSRLVIGDVSPGRDAAAAAATGDRCRRSCAPIASALSESPVTLVASHSPITYL